MEQAGKSGGGHRDGPLPWAGFPSMLRVRNDSASKIERFAAISLSGPVNDEPDDEAIGSWFANLAFKAELAGASDKLAIAIDPIAAGAFGMAVVDGVTPARVKRTSESHDHARADAGEPHLVMDEEGAAEIIWIEQGAADEVVWALVRLVNPAESDDAGGSEPDTAAVFPAVLISAHEVADHQWRYHWRRVEPVLLADGDVGWRIISAGGSSNDCQRCVNLFEMVAPAKMENVGGPNLRRLAYPVSDTSTGIVTGEAIVMMSTVNYAAIDDPDSSPAPHEAGHDCVNTNGQASLEESTLRYFYGVNPMVCGVEEE